MLEDRTLSWRARGILAYLLSRPPLWETNSEALAAFGKEGREAVRTALRELQVARYLHRPRQQGSDGRWATDWLIADHPFDPSDDGLFPPQGVDNPVDESGDNWATEAQETDGRFSGPL
jgi:hypothetical protein